MPYERYRNSADPAGQILLDCGISRLPVDIDTICEKLGICAVSYDAGAEVIERAHMYRAARDANGLTFYWRDTPVILFNERRELQEVLFTAAHELGHIILQHVYPGRPVTACKGAKWNATRKETAANQFAAQLLAPACILRGMGLHTPEEIMRSCVVPRQAAAYSARRLERFAQQKALFASPLEQALCSQFQLHNRKDF